MVDTYKSGYQVYTSIQYIHWKLCIVREWYPALYRCQFIEWFKQREVGKSQLKNNHTLFIGLFARQDEKINMKCGFVYDVSVTLQLRDSL